MNYLPIGVVKEKRSNNNPTNQSDETVLSPKNNKEDKLYKETLVYLNSPFKMNFSEEALKSWGKIFFLIGEQKDIALKEDRFLYDLFTFIDKSDGETPLSILGDPGSGISPCLSALYKIFYNKYYAKETQYYPVYIDFRKFRVKIYKDDKDLLSQAKEYVKNEMDVILSFLKECNIENVLLIYDGIDCTSQFQEPLEDIIVNKFSYSIKKKIIGNRAHINKEKVQRRENNGAVITFQLTDIEDKKFDKLIENYSAIDNKNIDINQLKMILKKCNFDEIDIFLLRLIFNSIEDTLKNGDVHFLFDKFCLEHLDKTKLNGDYIIDEIARFAFDYNFTRRNDPYTEDDLFHNPAWYLFNRNKEIQHFLIAKHVINLLVLIAKGNRKIDFNYVHKKEVNSYCRYLINIDPNTQDFVLNGAEKVLRIKRNFSAHANALYLLGRLKGRGSEFKAIKIIKGYLKNGNSKNSSTTDDPSLLALRTGYISLACLGDKTASDEYIQKLLSNNEWCSTNRGFHLRYYGDKYHEQVDGLIPKDELDDCSETYQHLYNQIDTLNKKPLTDIEIYTLFSLIQHRHEAGKFHNETELKKLTELIDKILDKDIIECIDLKLYLRFLKEIFEKPTYSKFTLLKQINNIKFEKRKGWVRRGFNENKIEVVASHTLNAVYMASLLLPHECGNNPDYNKNIIMDMLLYHDLAECDIHDHLPEEKTADVKSKEKDFYEKLSMYRTYGFFDTKKIYDLWYEFENKDTINSKVANEIDKIEAYTQLLSYLESGEKTEKSDFKKWRNEINDIVETDYGRKIKNYIESEFKSVIEKYSH